MAYKLSLQRKNSNSMHNITEKKQYLNCGSKIHTKKIAKKR